MFLAGQSCLSFTLMGNNLQIHLQRAFWQGTESSPDRSLSYSDLACNLRPGMALSSQKRNPLGVDTNARASKPFPFRSSARHTGTYSFADQFALKLGDTREDTKNKS